MAIARRLCNRHRYRRSIKSWTYNIGYATNIICMPLHQLKIETDIINPTKITERGGYNVCWSWN